MSIEYKKLLHWSYFLTLEDDIKRLSRYIEFTEPNFKTFSTEIAHIYLAAASEVDVVAKQLSKKISPSLNPRNINEYRQIIDNAIPNLKKESVCLLRYNLKFTPWDEWHNNESPSWWHFYNKIKHERHQYYEEANLKNVLNAISGLFLLVLHYYRNEPKCKFIEPPPSIFNPPSDIGSIHPTLVGRPVLFFK